MSTQDILAADMRQAVELIGALTAKPEKKRIAYEVHPTLVAQAQARRAWCPSASRQQMVAAGPQLNGAPSAAEAVAASQRLPASAPIKPQQGAVNFTAHCGPAAAPAAPAPAPASCSAQAPSALQPPLAAGAGVCFPQEGGPSAGVGPRPRLCHRAAGHPPRRDRAVVGALISGGHLCDAGRNHRCAAAMTGHTQAHVCTLYSEAAVALLALSPPRSLY